MREQTQGYGDQSSLHSYNRFGSIRMLPLSCRVALSTWTTSCPTAFWKVFPVLKCEGSRPKMNKQLRRASIWTSGGSRGRPPHGWHLSSSTPCSYAVAATRCSATVVESFVDLVQEAHQGQILRWDPGGVGIHRRPRHIEQLAASCDCQRVGSLNHRSALAHRSRPSALDKQSFSIVS